MIRNNFYPDQTPITGDLIPTATIRNIAGLTDMDADPSAAYQMGYIPPNDAKWISPRKTTISADGVKTEIDNIGAYWGFGVFNFYASRYNHPVYFDRNANIWAGTSRYSSDINFFNSMRAYALKYVDQSFTLQIRKLTTTEYTISPTTEKILQINSDSYCGEISFNMLSFIDFVENGTAKTVGGYTVHYSDFIDGTHMDIGNGEFLVVRATTFLPLSYYDTYTQNLSIEPFISTRVPRTGADGNDIVIGSPNTFMSDTSTYCRFAVPYDFVFSNDTSVLFVDYLNGWRYNGYNHFVYEDGVQAPTGTSVMTSLDFELSQVRMNYIARNEGQKFIIPEQFNSMWMSMRGYYHDNIWTIGFRNDDAFQIGSLEKIYSFCKFYHRVGNSTAPGSEYKTGDYVGIYNNNNPNELRAFTTYRDVEPELMIWQKYGYNIYDDEYDPDTPPTPGGDDPGSDEPVETPLVTGDDQELQTDRTLATPNDFITMYNITPPMLTIFGKTLWKSIVDYDPNDPTSVEVFKNFFALINQSVTGSIDIGSMLQFVVSVRQYPFNVAGLGITESAGNSIKIGTGKFPIELGSAANVQRLTSTIGLLDCGTVTIADYSDFKLYNDFRDYLNSSVSAFLPYCGTVELNPIEVIHNTLHCYYAIDFYTGECTAYITCTDGTHEWISAIKNGTIGVLIPITATNSGQISARHQSDNAKDSGLIASTMGNLFSAVANVATGNIVGAVGNVVGIAQNDAQQRQMDAERQGRSAIMAPSLSGGSGAAAFYQPSCASVLVRRGTYARDKIANYPSTCAYPATTSGTLNSFHGYTECYNVDVDKLNCNEEERAQVKMILESGVYLP